MRVAIVSDTHLPGPLNTLDSLGPEVNAFFKGVDIVLHAGDVTSPLVLEWLEQFAPIVVATGNNDNFDHPCMKPVQRIDLEGWRIGMVHSLVREDRPIADMERAHFGTKVDVLIGGHTHLERLECRDGAVLLNPGSLVLPHHKDARLGTVAVLELTRETLHAEVIPLGHTPGRPNPGRSLRLSVHR
jgi:hypothetical protein